MACTILVLLCIAVSGIILNVSLTRKTRTTFETIEIAKTTGTILLQSKD
jgi:hypothetical protein